MSAREKLSFVKKIYCIIGIFLLLGSTYLVIKLVMHIWHKVPEESAHEKKMTEEEKMFKNMMEGVEKKAEYDLGYKVIKEEKIEDHFHHIGNMPKHDKFNLCISCHGDVPHDKSKEIRAFLNMHSDFLACETCHIKIEKDSHKKYVWYSKESGKLKDINGIEDYLSNANYKLMPLKYEKDDFVRFDSEQLREFVQKFKKILPELGPSRKSRGLKMIHKSTSEKPVSCGECHAKTLEESYLPLREVGYTNGRVAQILGNEVVGMVKKYEKFYIPKLFSPGQKENKNQGSKEE